MTSLTAQFPQRKPSTASPDKLAVAAGAPPSPGPSQETSGPRTRSKEWLELRRREHMDVCNMLNLDELTRKLSWDMLYRMYQRGVGDEVRHDPFGHGPGPAELGLSASGAAILCDLPNQIHALHTQYSLCAIWVAGRVNMIPDGPKNSRIPGNGVTASQLAAASNTSYGWIAQLTKQSGPAARADRAPARASIECERVPGWKTF